MKNKTTLVAGFMLLTTTLVGAYSNSSMTGPYQKLIYGDPIHAIHDANTAAWGQWFWLILAAGPYIGLWIHQRSFNNATIWLTCVLAAYGGLFFGATDTGASIPPHIFYLLVVVWVLSVLAKLIFPIYKN